MRVRYLGALVKLGARFMHSDSKSLAMYRLAEFPSLTQRAEVVATMQRHIAPTIQPGTDAPLVGTNAPLVAPSPELLSDLAVFADYDDIALVHLYGLPTLIAVRLIEETTLTIERWVLDDAATVETCCDFNSPGDVRVYASTKNELFSGSGETQTEAWVECVDAMKRGTTWKR